MVRDAHGELSASYPARRWVRDPRPPAAPWTVHLADAEGRFWFAVFDLDAKKPEDRAAAAEELGVLVRLLEGENVQHVVLRSSPGGGYHVWVPTAALQLSLMEQLADAAKAVLRETLDHGMLHNASSGAVRPPLSPHPAGGASQLVAGDLAMLHRDAPGRVDAERMLRVIAAFRQLRPADSPEQEQPTARLVPGYRPRRPLSPHGERSMAVAGGGANPSHNGYLCLLAAARAGWSFDDVRHAAQTAPGMEHYRTKRLPSGRRRRLQPAEAEARMRRQWERALDHVVTDSVRPDWAAPKDLAGLAALVDDVDAVMTGLRVSPGRWATTEHGLHDATVLRAIAWLTLTSGSRAVAAAKRSVATLTGIPAATVRTSLARLVDGGHLVRVRASDGDHAAVYAFESTFSTARQQVEPLHNLNARPPGQVFDARTVLLDQLTDELDAGRHDIFTRAGLGPTARRVYEALQKSDHRPDEAIADRAGLPLGRVRAALRILRRHSLSTRARGGWRRRLHDYRRRIAAALGVDGLLDRRNALYAAEREMWAWWKDHLATRGGRQPRTRQRQDPHSPASMPVRFVLTDARGGPDVYPEYPTHPDGRGDHTTAYRVATTIGLQAFRDSELAA
jgi:hypothetical protein